jgi:hypothetical protein
MADLTTQILIEIRDEIRELRRDTNERIDLTNQRLESTNERVERVERRQTESELRLASEIVAVAGAVHELKDAVIAELRLSSRVEDHEQRLQALERGVKH